MATRSNGKKQTKLALTMVVRDCAATLEPLLKQMKPFVDEIIIVLGGPSSDKTPVVAAKYADTIVHNYEWKWDWADARNVALSHVTAEYFMWLDGDDIMGNPAGLADIVRAMDRGNLDRVDLMYEYAFDEDGNLLTCHHRERIMRTAKQWHWLDRLHETCNTDLRHTAAYDNTVKVIHKRGNEVNQSERNLPILLEMMEDDPKPRTLIHLAHAYYSLGKWEEAIFYYEQYCDAPENDLNQWSAQIMAARCAFSLGDMTRTQLWAMSAAQLLPQYQDPYVLLAAAVWYAEFDIDKAWAWLRQAKESKDAPLQVFRLPADNQAMIWDIEHRLLATEKKWAEALAVAEDAVERFPAKEEWKTFAFFYRECVFTERSRVGALQLADHMIRHGDVIRAKTLLESFLPSTLRDDPAITGAKTRVYQMLDSNHDEDYKDADEFYGEWDVEQFPRFKWYVERLEAIGAKKVLEVGCHHGIISRKLAKRGIECVGVDFNEKVIEIANERSEGLDPKPRFYVGRMEDIREKFDAVLLAEILEHVTPSVQIQMLNYAETLAPVVLGSVPAEPIGMCAGLWEDSDIGVSTFRPHIFEFDQNDMETLILTDPERRIINCHKIANHETPIAGFGNRVFEFTRQPQEKKGIGITIMLGPGHEMWTPDDIEGKGVGGSETAAVRLAEELQRRGHMVMVYGPETGVYNGVVYRDWKQYDPAEEREVLIVSRELAPLTERPNAAFVALWCHDIAYDDGDFTEEIAANVDQVVVMSEWQKGYWHERYPWLEKVSVIGNAVRLYDVADMERKRHRFIYSSSPDRGLDDLLVRWPLIREMAPDAELHVFYGWQYLDTVPQLRGFKRDVLTLSRQEGVVMHGRLGQRELAAEFAKAHFWLYPSILPRTNGQVTNGPDFHETFCISALEAQMYGAIPVTRKVGALAERFDGDQFFVDPWVTGNIMQTLKTWDDLWGTEEMEECRREMRENALQYTWQSVADRWLALIAGQLIEKFGELVEA